MKSTTEPPSLHLAPGKTSAVGKSNLGFYRRHHLLRCGLQSIWCNNNIVYRTLNAIVIGARWKIAKQSEYPLHDTREHDVLDDPQFSQHRAVKQIALHESKQLTSTTPLIRL
jgi:hypothetical protein